MCIGFNHNHDMDLPMCLDDFEKYAEKNLPQNAWIYYSTGADEETTLKENIDAFRRWKILPRVLRDVSVRDTSTSILGHTIPFPVCIAPSAAHKLAHSEGEVATAIGAAEKHIAFTLSNYATETIENVAQSAPTGIHFLQIYIFKRDKALPLIHRAEKCGFKALVVTIDSPVVGKKRHANIKLPCNIRYAMVDDIEAKCCVASVHENETPLTWDDIEWLKSVTTLPIILKGILHPDDAVKAVEVGVSGMLVSNHGGRQLDGVPATIDVLPDVVAAVAGRCEVYMDGGVRTGTDVVKALALGARAVFVGRPVLYGLAYSGSSGVAKVLDILKEEFSSAMALCGCSSVNGINSKLLRHQDYYIRRSLANVHD